jgi:hypothetical protein
MINFGGRLRMGLAEVTWIVDAEEGRSGYGTKKHVPSKTTSRS